MDLRLAPMAGVTNAPFRLVCREAGAGLLTSEEIDARALVEGNARTQAIAHYLPEERPIAFQLLGGDPDVLAEAARRLAATGADGIDLNMGCPVSKIVAKGQGAALMRDPLRAAVIFRTLRKAVDVPFTIKIRSGWDERTVNAVEIARIAEGEGVDAITVHPRTRSQQYTGRAPWAIIREVVAAVSVPVVGNGDVPGRAACRGSGDVLGQLVKQLFFEDFGVGDRFGSPSRTLTDAHFMFFAGMTGDAHPIHYDDEYAKKTRFGRRLAHGLLLTSLTAVGASTLAPLIEDSIVAFLDQSTRFVAPAFVGDTLKPDHEVIALERKRSGGLVTLKVTLTNQRGELVLEGQHKYLIAYRPAA